MSKPELVRTILPRAVPQVDAVEQVTRLSAEAHQAHEDFLAAGVRFAALTQQIADLKTELMQAALDMHDAMHRSDQAVAEVKKMAGMT